MADPFVGEIRIFAGNFAPTGWAFCDGKLIPISENEPLFNLIGTTYGGDGESTFALPDLRGRIPIHQGNGFILAENGGAEEITLTVNQIPAHTHPLLGKNDAATQPNPGGQVHARFSQANLHPYIEDAPNIDMAPNGDRPGRRQPAAHELPALPLRQLHHLAVRLLPEPVRGRADGRPVRRRDPDLPVQLRAERLGLVRRADPALPRTRRCSRSSGRRTAATARRTSPCPTSAGGRRCTPATARARASRSIRWARARAPRPSPCSRARSLRIPIACARTRPRATRRFRAETRSPGPPRPSIYQTNSSSNLTAMAPEALPPAGGDVPHNNLQPYLTMYFNIALQGVFPPRN